MYFISIKTLSSSVFDSIVPSPFLLKRPPGTFRLHAVLAAVLFIVCFLYLISFILLSQAKEDGGLTASCLGLRRSRKNFVFKATSDDFSPNESTTILTEVARTWRSALNYSNCGSELGDGIFRKEKIYIQRTRRRHGSHLVKLFQGRQLSCVFI